MEFGYDIPDLKGKDFPIHYMKTYSGVEGIVPLFNLGTTRTTVVGLMPSPHYC
jgi:hypothetical protein